MTEEQRMEEGRRMFQIFAARMFEQRVLTAYREKVARERQRKLIEELEEETRLDTQREAKKAKEAAKKKEKKKLQKQAKDEEKAKKEAEKAAQEAAARAVEERKLEEQRQRKEEQRKKRELEKKAAEEERLRKEAEKQRKVQEERERQQDLERKQREAKDREKRKREEARKKEREEKDAKEREARGRKAKEDKERMALEMQARREKEAAAIAEKETRDRARHEEQVRQIAKRPSIAIPPGLHAAHPSAVHSPQIQVATPIMPAKAPTPARPRQASQQGPQSHGSSPRSQQAAMTETTLSSTTSSISIAIPNSSTSANAPGKQQGQGPPLHHPQPSAPLSPLSGQTRSSQPPPGYNGMPGPSANGTAPAGLGMLPGTMPQMGMYQGPPVGVPHRGYGPPNGMAFPLGMNGNRHFAQAPNSHFQHQTPMAPPAPVIQKQPVKSQTHSRQQSTSYDRLIDPATQLNPISRPAPIGQSSTSTPEKKENRKVPDTEVDQLATQLGSKALLDDSDIPLSASSSDHMSAPGAPGSGRAPFTNFPDSKHDAFQSGHWGAFSPNGGFAGQPHWGAPGLTPKQGGGGWPTHHQVSANNAFGIIGGGVHATHRPHASRPVAIRLMVAEACKKLSATPGTANDGYHPAQFLLRQIEQMKPPHEPVVTLNEMLEICDTEGNAQNGGGSFIVRKDSFQGQSVKFEPAGGTGSQRPVGDIGSPIVAHSQLATFGGIGQPVSGVGTKGGH
jgi:chemotaxis protein histidine kinase CheA